MAGDGKHPVLIVDDEPEILYSMQGLLRMEFDVSTAESAEEALALLRERPFHVIMTDQRMPEMTGVELLRRAQEIAPDAIRVVFTGYSDVKAVISAINEGRVFRYLTKPWEPDELLGVLRQAVAEYERAAERRHLFSDVQGYAGQALAFVDGLRDGRLGTLNPAGEAEAVVVAEAGRALLGRVAQTETA